MDKGRESGDLQVSAILNDLFRTSSLAAIKVATELNLKL